MKFVKNIGKIIKITTVIAVIVFSAFTTPTIFNTVYAWDDGLDAGSGCCGGGDFGGGGFGGDPFGDSWWGASDGDVYSLHETTYTPPPPPAPTCTISADPNPANYDGTVTLSWTTTNATGASINGVGFVQVGSGSMDIPNFKQKTTYTMTVTGAGGTATCEVTVDVKPRPTCTISADPSTVDYNGNTTLSWSTQNATSATISGIGSVGLNGSYTVSGLTSDKTYTMTVKGDGGENTCSVNVKVRKPENNLSCNITATPNPNHDGETTLVWSSSGASWAFINNGVGTVSTSGSKKISDLENGTKVYTLTVGSSHSSGFTRTCSVSVTTDRYVFAHNPAPNCTITASRTYVPLGEGTTLYWTSQNADTLVWQDNGVAQSSGSRVVYPTHSGYYTLIATAKNGEQSKCSVYITVDTPQTVVTISSMPYTGPEDGLYVAVMSAVFFGSLFTLYRRRQYIMELVR